jgi:hypothetical protein
MDSGKLDELLRVANVFPESAPTEAARARIRMVGMFALGLIRWSSGILSGQVKDKTTRPENFRGGQRHFFEGELALRLALDLARLTSEDKAPEPGAAH